MLDQKKNEDVSQYLRHGVIKNLLEMLNPFNQTDSERLTLQQEWLHIYIQQRFY